MERNENGFGFWSGSLQSLMRLGIWLYVLDSTAAWTELTSVENEETG